jgi:hypothetical protein
VNPLVPGDGFDIADLAMYAGWVAVILGTLALLWRWLLKAPVARVRCYLEWHERFREEWEGTEVDPSKPWQPRTTGVLERLNLLDGEFADDGNGSLKSSVRRIESMMTNLTQQVQRVEQRQIGIGERLNRVDERLIALEHRPPAA